ncbi:MAG: hypothetical protein NZ108_02780, partial [Bacteroidia bacterium]|nr:hypothetical protein [Bacteroidia bacterium]
MPNRLKFTLVLFYFHFSIAFSQVNQTINVGDTVSVLTNTIFSVKGNLWNTAAGKFFHSGQLYITDSLMNNAGNQMFMNGLPGTVHLIGGNQIIGGTDTIYFYNLNLRGTGIKTLNQHEVVLHRLDLDQRELATLSNRLFVLNPAENAIVRLDSGIVSSELNGWLYRRTAPDSLYLFPVGSSTGTWRYRPVEIKTNITSGQDTFGVRFANTNATTEGFSINLKDSSLCQINPDFYHWLSRQSGQDSVGIIFYYDPATDPIHQTLAHWDGSPQEWKHIGPATNQNGTPFSSLSRNWSDFSPHPFAMAILNPEATFAAINPEYCENDPPVTLSGSPTGGIFSGPGVSGNVFSPSLAGPGTHTLFYIYTDGNSCVDSVPQTVIVHPKPTVTVSNSGPLTFCQGGTVTLTANPGNATYLWNTGETTQSITVNQSGLFNVIVTNSFQCSDSLTNSISVTVHANPIASISANGPTTFCQDDSVTLTASPVSGVTYLWTNGQTAASITVTSAGEYNVEVTDANGCKDTADVPISVIVNPNPDV